MSRDNGTGEILLCLVKIPFSNLCWCTNSEGPVLHALAAIAGVSKETVEQMVTGIAVRRADAIAVLAAFSRFTVEKWTLDNVEVSLLEEEGAA